MGDSNYGGNGSVYWSVDHEDGQDLRVRTNAQARPRKGDRENVHAKTKMYGRDESKGAVEYFDVTLRFEKQQTPSAMSQLTKALEQAASAPVNSSFFVTFRVPATVNKKQRENPEEQPWPDVRVQW